MLVLTGRLLDVAPLEARGNFPPSSIVSLFDREARSTLSLVADTETAEALASLGENADVALRLRWRLLDLASLGGSGRGKAYRLSVVGLADGDAER